MPSRQPDGQNINGDHRRHLRTAGGGNENNRQRDGLRCPHATKAQHPESVPTAPAEILRGRPITEGRGTATEKAYLKVTKLYFAERIDVIRLCAFLRATQKFRHRNLERFLT